MDPVWWAVILMVGGFGFALLEVFLPSGGILSLLCGGALLASVIVAGTESLGLALLFGVVAVIGTPIVLLVAFKLLPRSPIGKRLILRSPDEDAGPTTSPPVSATSVANLSELMGREGVATTALRPSGIAEIGGRRVSVVTEGEMVAKGQKVRVIEIHGNQVVVEAVTTA
jgi:membrane-bound serine protease (ClpP class)